MNNEKKAKQKRIQQMSSRHSRFGTNIVVKDKNSQLERILPGIPNTEMIRKKDVGRKTAPKRKNKGTDGPAGMLIHFRKFGDMNISGSEEEETVKADLKKMGNDLIQNSFNSLIDVLLESFYSSSDSSEDDHEVLKYIKISSFFMSFSRLNAYEELKDAKAKQRQEPASVRGPEPKLKLPIQKLSSTLKLQNIDFIFSKGFFQLLADRKSDRKMEMYLASVEYLLELLYIVKEMEQSDSEKLRNNAQILKQKIFTLQVCELAKFGLDTYEGSTQTKYFINTVLRFTHVLLSMLETYSKGRNLFIQTHKVRASSKRTSGQDDGEEGALEYADDDAGHYTQKRFNYEATIKEFVRYEIIENFVNILKHPQYMDDELIEAFSSLMNRIIRQAKGTWIFYQLTTFTVFESFLCDNKKELRFLSIVN
jgi:hypothetical protein